jgi:hypothetical protein
MADRDRPGECGEQVVFAYPQREWPVLNLAAPIGVPHTQYLRHDVCRACGRVVHAMPEARLVNGCTESHDHAHLSLRAVRLISSPCPNPSGIQRSVLKRSREPGFGVPRGPSVLGLPMARQTGRAAAGGVCIESNRLPELPPPPMPAVCGARGLKA